MTKLLILSFFLLGFNSLMYSQTGDTLYFDYLWHPCKKEEAKYYRLTKQIDGKYQIQDYYENGFLQMEGLAISLDPEILDGKCTYYHANGNIKSTGSYAKGSPIGIWNYYNAKGKLTSSYDFVLRMGTKIDADMLPEKQYTRAISENDKNFSMAVRGKLFGFFIIEDTYFSTATVGTELMFKGRHSLGIDYTYFGWQYEKDNTKDEALYETYERRGYVYVDYKCRLFSYKIFDLYFNMYDKYGTYHMWQEGVTEGYNAWEKPWLKDKTDGTFNQVGAGLGVKVYLSDRFYIDGSANGGKLFSDNNAVTHDSLGIANTQYHVKSEKNIFYIRINFGYKLFVKQKNKQDVFYTN